nr:hypothetical protein [Candidatus Sigynarchaeum springense]
MSHLKASDFCASSKDKIMLNWYCYEMALSLEMALEQHREIPAIKKWLKKSMITPMILDISARLKHVIVTKDLSSAMSLAVAPSWIEKHVRDMPREKVNVIATSLTQVIRSQAKECQRCQANCLRLKNHPCSLFDDPAYHIPPRTRGRGGSKRGERKINESRINNLVKSNFDGQEKKVPSLLVNKAKNLVTGYLENLKASVKGPTLRVHERVLQTWIDFIRDHKRYTDRDDARSFAAAIRDFIDSFEFLVEEFATSTTALKQVPAVLKKFINHVASECKFDTKIVDDLFDHLGTLRAEINGMVNSDEMDEKASRNYQNTQRSFSEELASILETPEFFDTLQAYADGSISREKFAARLSSVSGFPMDPASQSAFNRFVMPHADNFVKMIRSTGKRIDKLLDEDDSQPTNFDAAMSAIAKIPRDDLSKLMAVTTSIYDLAPWKYLKDTQIIAVKDPATGTVWYCSIMGMLGQHIGIMAYPGDEGLASFIALAARGNLPVKDLFLRQAGLYLAFESRDYIEAPDKFMLDAAGSSAKDSRCCPQFRDFTPGYYPWILTADQVRLFTLILSQVLDVSRRGKNALRRLPDIQFDHAVLVRERVDVAGLPEGWRETITPVAQTSRVEKKYSFLIASRPEMRLDKVPEKISAKAAKIQQSGKFQARESPNIVDFEFIHTFMNCQDDAERPYYPDMMITVDHQSGYVYRSELVKPGTPWTEMMDTFLEVLESCECVPAIINVLSSNTASIIEPVTNLLGIKVVRKDHLPQLEDAITSLKANLEEEVI